MRSSRGQNASAPFAHATSRAGDFAPPYRFFGRMRGGLQHRRFLCIPNIGRGASSSPFLVPRPHGRAPRSRSRQAACSRSACCGRRPLLRLRREWSRFREGLREASRSRAAMSSSNSALLNPVCNSFPNWLPNWLTSKSMSSSPRGSCAACSPTSDQHHSDCRS